MTASSGLRGERLSYPQADQSTHCSAATVSGERLSRPAADRLHFPTSARRAPRRDRRKPLAFVTYNANGWTRLRGFLEEGAAGALIVASQELHVRGDQRFQAEESVSYTHLTLPTILLV
eukprot:1037027-Pyramimonas_sp.AAC.1